ncbi:2-phospho-L-lactate guanylyltransferase [Halosimplex salinum]|uniref:2-phospho-L-lactate guanylyltransferase n=1 Tax=Halosimplex salinum TaxID=1710538 RepID=UPI000F4A42F2|nr:2-phospho-L-lactate guanylyltransferase [Halosimplex salinum]
MRVVVPFDAERPKTRLAALLDEAERAAFARAMLDDVLDALSTLDSERRVSVDPLVLATTPVDCDAPVAVDDRPLTEAVNARLPEGADDDPVAVVMADLALATPDALERLFEPDADVVLAPGRGGGTNALVVRDADFRVDYHGASFRDHREIAREVGATLAVVDSVRLSTDVDESADLVEVLLHGEGGAAEWLRDAGFELATDEGRVEVERNSG